MLSKLKAMFRQAAQRSVEELWTNIDEFLDPLTPEKRQIDMRLAGYA